MRGGVVSDDHAKKMGFLTSQPGAKPKARPKPGKRPRVPTHPEVWREIKDRWRATDEGTEPGRWGARKSVLAQREYAERGGGFVEVEE